MANETIKIGGKAYSANDVEVFFLGRIVRGVTEINFNSKKDIADVHVVGSAQPIDYIEGMETAEGDITILMDEVIGLEIAANGSVLNLNPFDITITFKKLPVVMQQVLKGCKPKERALQVKAGSTDALAWKIPMRIQSIPGLKPL